MIREGLSLVVRQKFWVANNFGVVCKVQLIAGGLCMSIGGLYVSIGEALCVSLCVCEGI